MRDADSKLIALLKANAREPTASLARKLGLARSTVQEKIAKLEKDGTIEGYTVKLSDAREARRLRAIVMISADPKQADRVAAELKRMHEVRALYAVSGAYDMIAVVETETTAKMDTSLDRIGRATGVARTVSSIVLSEKFVRWSALNSRRPILLCHSRRAAQSRGEGREPRSKSFVAIEI